MHKRNQAAELDRLTGLVDDQVLKVAFLGGFHDHFARRESQRRQDHFAAANNFLLQVFAFILRRSLRLQLRVLPAAHHVELLFHVAPVEALAVLRILEDVLFLLFVISARRLASLHQRFEGSRLQLPLV